MKTRLLLSTFLTLLAAQFALAQFELTMNFQQFDPHINQRLELRVIDRADSAEVGRMVVPSIPASDFSLALYTLVEGHSYNIDFFADFNDNGVYDPPPADHAWRLTLDNATQDTILTFTHNTNFTDIFWPGPVDFGTYEAIWVGIWKNLTFSSTDSIKANIKINADSIHALATTKGVFGDPAQVTFDLRQEMPDNFDWATDTIRFYASSPWSGEITIVNGKLRGGFGYFDEISGDTVAFNLTGNLGLKQMVTVYTVTSNSVPFANGYSILHEDTVLVHIPTCNPSTSSITETTCDSYISPSGKVWTTSGIYIDTIPNSEGCDSIITIDLTIDCYNSILRGETLQVSVYPNPTTGKIFIEFDDLNTEILLEVYTVSGKLVSTEKYFNTKQIINNLKGAKNIYYIRLTNSKGEESVFKVLKK
jgi:hypothetical protein